MGRTLLKRAAVFFEECPVICDIAIEGTTITEVGDLVERPSDEVIDCTGRAVFPGFIDTHSHAEARVFDEEVQLALLRQGITTIIGGQDGVSFAPGDGAYSSSYFAAINGSHPHYSGERVSDLLSTYDETVPLNVAYLVPAGTVRYEVMGRRADSPTNGELTAMTDLVVQGLEDGAVGVSSGMDYVPGVFAESEELRSLCLPLVESDAVYVTHMRGYEGRSSQGIDELIATTRSTGIRVHVSHFHAEPQVVLSQLDRMESEGIDCTFDAYPYTKGFTILSMVMLPPQLLERSTDQVVRVLSSADPLSEMPAGWSERVGQKTGLGSNWTDHLTYAHVSAHEFRWVVGLTLSQAGLRVAIDPLHFALTVLAASELEVSVTMDVPNNRSMDDLVSILSDPRHMGGSDGIFIGGHPHPRAYGCFARYVAEFSTSRGALSGRDLLRHLSANPARRFNLGRRGAIAPGWIADIAILDLDQVSDLATYENPLEKSVGVMDVIVAGRVVLRDGSLTGELAGSGIRRSQPIPETFGAGEKDGSWPRA